MEMEIKWLLDRAKESLQAAELMLQGALLHSSVSEGYYAMFYAAQALLMVKGENASTHKGVLTRFSAVYIKTGELDRAFGIALSKAFAARGKADYEIGLEISRTEAESVVSAARHFLEAAMDKLKDTDS